jgi:phosphoribosylformimino-5-aminoimidazole carboxamide ribotide isomerase
MLLIIPVIEIKNGKCARTVQGGTERFSLDDPVEMARMWRRENAKCLHITDIDGARSGKIVNTHVITEIVRSVDIPIELTGGIRNFEEVNKAFSLGVTRVIIGTMTIENPEDAIRSLQTFGPSTVILGLDSQNGFVKTYGDVSDTGLHSVSVALNAKQMGFTRIVYKDVLHYGKMISPNFGAIKSLAKQLQMQSQGVKMRITIAGGISDLQDVLTLQGLEPLGIDSVIIGRALYENLFSCQQLWRMSEAGNFPFTAKVLPMTTVE